MSAADMPILDAIRSLAQPDDPRHVEKIKRLANDVAAYLQSLGDESAGDRISMAIDYLTLCRTLAVQRVRIDTLEAQMAALQQKQAT